MQVKTYDEVRNLMKPGDVIAFGGEGPLSEVIKKSTFSPVSHVGIILNNNDIDGLDVFNLIIESTSLGDGFAGVQINRMSLHIKTYKGQIWWLPLSAETRAKMNITKFLAFCASKEGVPYDAMQAVRSRLDDFPLVKDNEEDFSKLFCSELDTAALEFSGAIGTINASTQTPQDVCEFAIYDDYVQLLGPTEVIPNFNTNKV